MTILMYHKVDLESPTMWWVSVDRFYQQMLDLKSKQVVYLDDYNPENPNQVVITFDGIYQNILQYAAPILQTFNYPFELFITSNYIGINNTFDSVEPLAQFANLQELKLLVMMKGRLQWHTNSHIDLTADLKAVDILAELDIPENIRELDPLGYKWFAYPYGRFDQDVLLAVKDRFSGAVSCHQGNDSDIYCLNRLTVTNDSNFSKAKIAVIIASYNYGSFLVEAIESVLRQTRLPDEILISDDASSDNTYEIATFYHHKYPNLIKINRNEKNLGIVDHFNKAIRLTSAAYITILGADNRYRSDYLEKTAEILDASEDTAIAYTDFALFGQRAKLVYATFPEDRRGTIKLDKFFIINFPDFTEESRQQLIEIGNFIHGSSLFRREAFEQVGGYLQFSNLPEDYALFRRIIEAGWQAKRARLTLLEYRQHSRYQTNIQLGSFGELQFYKNLAKENQVKLEQSRSELQEIQSKLDKIRSELDRSQPELDQSSSEFKNEDLSIESNEKLAIQPLLLDLPLIDISIVTYNSSKWIDTFFSSLLQQIYPTQLINILLTDNQSTDDTVELCQSISNNYSSRFNSFKIFECPNSGFGSGHNHNIEAGSTEYFLVSNIDLEFSHDAILKVVTTAIADDIDVASWEFRQKPFEHPKYYNPVTLETNWSAHACVLFRRSAFKYVNGYEEKIFLYGEDVELSYRLRDNGFRIKYCPSAVCWHYTYEYANQVKRLQFLGSTLANSYIRLRYGSAKEILKIALMYLKLFLSPPCIEGQRYGLLLNIYQIIINSFYFLSTRKKTKQLFPTSGWDYGFIKDGAFYNHLEPKIESSPLVSVIIRTYKGRLSYLQEAVSSVLNQTYPNIELVLVEDGSNEAKSYIEQIEKIGKLKIVYQEEPKLGRCHAGNIGLSLATGKFIVFLDDDDLFFADHIEILASELLDHPEIAATYSLSWEVSTKLISLSPLRYIEMSHDTIHRQKFSRLLMLHHNYIPIQSILFDRQLYKLHGGFDESLENLEDWNLWTRYCSKHDFLLIEKTTSMYRVNHNLMERVARQQSLDSYYSLAVEKQKELTLNVTRAEIIDFHQEMIRHESMKVSTKHMLKTIIFQSKYLKYAYYLLSAIKKRNWLLR
jgi:GT2 family glycosyltransferase